MELENWNFQLITVNSSVPPFRTGIVLSLVASDSRGAIDGWG